jgi:lysophospholipase L1-like esterase
LTILSLSLLFSFGLQIQAEEKEGEVIATLNGEAIYLSEIEQTAAFQVYRLKANIYHLLQRETEEIVNQRLLAQEATRRRMNIDDLLKKEVDEKARVPEEKELNEYLARYPEDLAKDPQRKDKVKTYLYQRALFQRKIDYLASLREKAEAIDAELPFANHWASWVNGYHGFWEWLFGLADVRSHNQRITKNFGSRGRKNFMEAKSGADMFDFPGQTLGSVNHQAHYVTVLLGHNDVCQNHFADIPSNEAFEANFTAGLENLREGLPLGATIYVVGIVDIYRLWKTARDKKALGIVDCEVLWATTVLDLFPCGTMLSPLNSEADRQLTRGRNQAFNQILERVTTEFNQQDPHHYYIYTDVVFSYPFVESQVSDIDCFHPSARGQRDLSDVTWDAGPFGAYQR